MNQKQLEIFITLAQNLNFTRTAEQLYLSQTTVTLQIRSLEEELHAKLFERTSRSVRLTYAGTVFLDGAVEILEKMQRTIDLTGAAARGYTGQLRIGFADDVNATGISVMLRNFTEQHPQIRLHVQGGYPAELLSRLLADEYDLIFTPSFRRLRNEHLSRYVVGTYQTIAAFHKDHRFAERKSVGYSDFAEENFIYISGESEDLDFSGLFYHQLLSRNIHVNLLDRTDNIDTVFLMLDADMGITVLPDYFTGRFAGTSQIRTCPIAESLKPTDYLAVWKPQKHERELELFLKILRQ
ncbi:MAG: LysR family transcriptional regulator [Parasporobacterium sp.]|nr:LysR family transcriptional regulator [Parasporobacterium sp.]